MSYSQIVFELREHVARITLNRPDACNAFTDVMREELKDAVDRINSDRDVRVVLLTGAGKAFSAGGDMQGMVDRLGSGQPFQKRRDAVRYRSGDTVQKLMSLRQPLIAAVNGAAVGAGCSLALCCDIRLASERAKFGVVQVKRGLVPDWGAGYFLPRLIGTSRAMELASTGRLIDAREALEMGLVNRVIQDGDFQEAVKGFCQEIARNAPLAVSAAKAAVYHGVRNDLESLLEYESCLHAMCQLTEDHREGVMAFVEKREAVFKGR